MADLILYRSNANWYFRIVSPIDIKVWDVAAVALSASTTWANSDTALTYSSVLGGHAVTIPATLVAGEYDLLFYNAATPANTDELMVGKRIFWNGANLTRLPRDL